MKQLSEIQSAIDISSFLNLQCCMPDSTYIKYFWIEIRQFGMFTESFSMANLKLLHTFQGRMHGRPDKTYANFKQ